MKLPLNFFSTSNIIPQDFIKFPFNQLSLEIPSNFIANLPAKFAREI
jgi:hypothetical protein